MSWQALTEADIFPHSAELDAVRSARLPEGVTAAEIMADVIDRQVAGAWDSLRAAVKRGHLSALGPAGTLPPSLIEPVAILVRTSVLGRVPGLQSLQNKIRDEELKAAREKLTDVATGRAVVEEHSESGTPPAITSPGPVVISRDTYFQREDQDGL